jgi:hypothetical protein
MNTVRNAGQIAPPVSPRSLARIAGLLYLTNLATIFGALYLLNGLVVGNDAAATVHNFIAREADFRWGFAAELVSSASSVGVAALLYEVFKPVSSSASLLAAAFRIVACAIAAVGYLFQLAPLQVIGAMSHLEAFKVQELQALALVLHAFSGATARISIVFFGFNFITLSFLIFRSQFLPKLLGLFAGLAGLAALGFLMPQIAVHFFPYFAAPGLLAEGSLALWLLIVGVNTQKWREQAIAAARSADSLLLGNFRFPQEPR